MTSLKIHRIVELTGLQGLNNVLQMGSLNIIEFI